MGKKICCLWTSDDSILSETDSVYKVCLTKVHFIILFFFSRTTKNHWRCQKSRLCLTSIIFSFGCLLPPYSSWSVVLSLCHVCVCLRSTNEKCNFGDVLILTALYRTYFSTWFPVQNFLFLVQIDGTSCDGERLFIVFERVRGFWLISEEHFQSNHFWFILIWNSLMTSLPPHINQM